MQEKKLKYKLEGSGWNSVFFQEVFPHNTETERLMFFMDLIP